MTWRFAQKDSAHQDWVRHPLTTRTRDTSRRPRRGSANDYPLALRHQDGTLTDVLYNASVSATTAGNSRRARRHPRHDQTEADRPRAGAWLVTHDRSTRLRAACWVLPIPRASGVWEQPLWPPETLRGHCFVPPSLGRSATVLDHPSDDLGTGWRRVSPRSNPREAKRSHTYPRKRWTVPGLVDTWISCAN
jgi:hypothetical protein